MLHKPLKEKSFKGFYFKLPTYMFTCEFIEAEASKRGIGILSDDFIEDMPQHVKNRLDLVMKMSFADGAKWMQQLIADRNCLEEKLK